MRDLALARLTGAPRPLPAPVDGRVGRPGPRRPRPAGLAVTAEVAPHHFTLTDAEVAGYDPVFKVNPPLRTAADVAAVKAGLADGTIDAIATDHAPHAQEAKEAALRPGSARACSAWRPRWPWPSPSSTCPSSGCSPCCRGSRPRSPAWRARHGGPVVAGPAGQPVRHRPGPPLDGRPGRLASRSRNTPYAGRS